MIPFIVRSTTYVEFLSWCVPILVISMLLRMKIIMKKLLPCICALLLVMSCKKDDVIVPQCTEATNIQATNITFNSVSLSWTDANASASFTIEYGVSGFLPGTGSLVNSTTTNIDLAGLAANTSYDIYVQSVCTNTNLSMQSDSYSFSTLPPLVLPQFLPNLSDLNIYMGDLSELTPTIYAFNYRLTTALFSDYAYKQRLIILPLGESMQFIDNGFPEFPDGTVITKTFSYNIDDRDESLGKTILETRVLIKINGSWELGNYHWNNDQTDATLATDSVTVPVSYIDEEGNTNNVDYVIPSQQDCFTCHSNAGNTVPIGPKLRTMNLNNQLQELIDSNYLLGVSDVSSISKLPDWTDTSYSREERARAYFDINCAHCHSVGGFCEVESTLRLPYETAFDDTNIFNQRFSIMVRMENYIEGFSMPLIGTTMVHEEGYELIESYLNSL